MWGIWACSVIAAFVLVGRFGNNVPYYDDWTLVQTLARAHPIDFDWLWVPRNGHRLVVPKLLILALYEITGWDFRTGMVASVVLLATASALLIMAASRLRGSLSFADAIFPLLLLNWGHYDNMLWGWQLTQVLPIAIAASLLAALARWGLDPPFPAALFAAAAVISLPLSGVPGLACTPGFAIWMLTVAYRRQQRRTPSDQREAIILWIAAVFALLLVAAYFVDLGNIGTPPFRPRRAAKVIALFSAHGFGPVAAVTLPWSLLAVVALFGSSAIVLVRAFWHGDSGARSRALALLFAIIAFGGIAASVGVGRPTTSLPHRYYLFAVPALLWIYLTLDLAPSRSTARVGRIIVLALALASAIGNASSGMSHARARNDEMKAFEADVRRGAPPSVLIARHQRTLLPFPEDGGAYAHDRITRGFEALRRARIGVFGALAPETGFRDVPLDAVSHQPVAENVERPLRVWEWQFTEASYVVGIRIPRPDGAGDAHLPTTLYWASDANQPFSRSRRYVHWWLEGETSATVWIHDTVSAVRLNLPSGTTSHHVPELQLLLPEE